MLPDLLLLREWDFERLLLFDLLLLPLLEWDFERLLLPLLEWDFDPDLLFEPDFDLEPLLLFEPDLLREPLFEWDFEACLRRFLRFFLRFFISQASAWFSLRTMIAGAANTAAVPSPNRRNASRRVIAGFWSAFFESAIRHSPCADKPLSE